MNYEDQIREMAEIIIKTAHIRGFEYSAAAGIFAAGYGKVKQAVKETVRAIYEEVEKIPHHNLSDEEGRGYVLAISAVLTALKKYESEVCDD